MVKYSGNYAALALISNIFRVTVCCGVKWMSQSDDLWMQHAHLLAIHLVNFEI